MTQPTSGSNLIGWVKRKTALVEGAASKGGRMGYLRP
jgi:hypothetical protein